MLCLVLDKNRYEGPDLPALLEEGQQGKEVVRRIIGKSVRWEWKLTF